MEEGGPLLTLNPAQTLGVTAAFVGLGLALRRVGWIARWNIPAAVAGGLVAAMLVLLLRGFGVAVRVEDQPLRELFMIAFFTTVGMNASWRSLRAGGRDTAMLLAMATVGAVVQNGLGVTLARAMGIAPLVGVVAGAVTLTGGPATALAFGREFEKAGLAGASALGIACATCGILAAGLLAGLLGGRLADRSAAPQSGSMQTEVIRQDSGSPLLANLIVLAIAMGLGSVITAGFERARVTLPGYIGGMIAAAVLRAVDDRWRVARISATSMALLGSMALQFFIVMALLSLRLWELVDLAVPVMAILAVEIVATCAMTLAVWRVMGRSYEAAVMSAGWAGFMLGTTANAVAAMDELTARRAPAPRAFLAVPVVGAFLIDFTNALVITATFNLLH